MSEILVYKAERDAGLTELIKASASIAYCAKVEDNIPSSEVMQRLSASLAKASESDNDLYVNQSILATTNWNLNDDVFDPLEVWVARATPAHKPDNLNHDEKQIVGHMIGAWPINLDGTLIPESTAADELPPIYHLVNNAVIYRNWQDEALAKRAEDLIAAIQAGEMFVSMECLFCGFDYAIKTPEGKNHILARTSDTAFLTKHLRAYKGTGEYEGNKVGRLMRNIIFSAKGYVKKPANPDSIIFENNFAQASKITTLFPKSGVSIQCNADLKSKENDKMAEDTKVLENQLAASQAEVKRLADELKALADQQTKAASEQAQKVISELTAQVQAGATELQTIKAQLETATAKNGELSQALEAMNAVKTQVETELTSLKTTAAQALRLSSLVDSGVAKEQATALVEKFASFTEEQFATVKDAIVGAVKKEETPVVAEKKDTVDSTTAANKVLDTAKPAAEVALGGTGGGEDDKTGRTRANLSKALAHRLGNSSQQE